MAIDRGQTVATSQPLASSDSTPVSSIDRGQGIAITQALADSFDVDTLLDEAKEIASKAETHENNAANFAVSGIQSMNSAAGYATDAKGYRDELTTLTTATETVAVDGSSTSSYDSSTGVLSLGIPTGATGAASTEVGPAGTLTVGTVSTGLEGTDVTITNIGTTSAAIFDITIPKGDTGAGSTEVGPDGDSAYTVAVTNGFSGNEAAWLTSLVSTAVGPAAATYDVTGTVLTITT